MMEFVLPLVLCLLWHVFVVGAGIWLGINKPWRWKVVRPEEQPTSHRASSPYPDDAFERVR